MKNLFLIILIIFVPVSALSFDSKTIINNISNSVSTGGNTSQGGKITTGDESEYVEVYSEEYDKYLGDLEDEEGYWVELETSINEEEKRDSKDLEESFEEEDEEISEKIEDLEVLFAEEDDTKIKEEKNFFRKIIDYVLFIFTFY